MSEPTRSPASYAVFVHLTAEKASLYRAILGVFVAERARFVISLRPGELHSALADSVFTQRNDLRALRSAASLKRDSDYRADLNPAAFPRSECPRTTLNLQVRFSSCGPNLKRFFVAVPQR